MAIAPTRAPVGDRELGAVASTGVAPTPAVISLPSVGTSRMVAGLDTHRGAPPHDTFPRAP